MAEAMAGIKDGSTVLIGGFGAVGQPNALIDGLIEQGATDLTVAANNAGVGHVGLARLMELGRVRKIICSFPRSSDPVVFETCIAPARSNWRSCRRARSPNACAPRAPACRRSSPPPASAPRWRWARRPANSTAAPT